MLKNALGFLIVVVLAARGCDPSPKEEEVGSEADVTSFASQVAPKLMAKYYPNTGNTPEYQVHSWNFDADSRMYTVDMSGFWIGRSCMLCDDTCQAEVRGTLTIGVNGGDYHFEITGVNDCVRQHNITGVVIGAVLDAAASSNN